MQKVPASMNPGEGPFRKVEYSIGDLAQIYGVSLRTLRFYEDKGLLNLRRQASARFYGASERIRLELILKGKKLGFTLSEIQDLIATRTKHGNEDAVASTDLTVRLDSEQIAAQIAHLERQRSALDDAITELRIAYARATEGEGS